MLANTRILGARVGDLPTLVANTGNRGVQDASTGSLLVNVDAPCWQGANTGRCWRMLASRVDIAIGRGRMPTNAMN